MAASLGDLIQLVDRQSYLGQEVLNVYYYRVVSIVGIEGDYLSEMETWFQENLLAPILDVQVDGLTHFERQWRNLSNGADLYIDSESFVGALAVSSTAYTPSFVTASFMLVRETTVTRNGYKRIAGLSDVQVSGNTWTPNPLEIAAIEEALAMDIEVGAVLYAEPVIVKRPMPAVPIATYDYSSVGSAMFRRVGTQNTRKATGFIPPA